MDILKQVLTVAGDLMGLGYDLIVHLGAWAWANMFDVFAVSYFGGAPAVVVYTVDGEKLVGEWTMGGAEGAVYSETLIRTGAAPAQEPGRQEREPRALPRDHPSVPSEPARFPLYSHAKRPRRQTSAKPSLSVRRKKARK